MHILLLKILKNKRIHCFYERKAAHFEVLQFIYFILGVNSLNTGEHEVPPVC